jgi:hypothetical protein
MAAAYVTGDTLWSAKPDGHLAVTRQRCGGCGAWASSWTRCPSCRAIIARCGDHGGSAAMSTARAACCRGRR